MPDCRLLDLASELLPALTASAGRPADEQIGIWYDYHRRRAPELLAKITGDYERSGLDWRAVARERVWPHIAARLDRMNAACRGLRQVHADVYQRSTEAIGVDFPVLFVAYVGIGGGAGWATRYGGQPAVLIGLENVAELGWHEPDAMAGLLAHEIGHLLMYELRQEEPGCGDPLCDLFEEGFAQRAEHLIMGRETWHCSSQEGWLEWCRRNESRLAGRFLAVMDDREQVREFFGSWFDVEGWRQTGYYLGCRTVERLARRCTLRDLAGLTRAEIRAGVESHLRSL